MEDIREDRETKMVEKEPVLDRFTGFFKRNGKKIAVVAVTVFGTAIVGGLVYAGTKMDLEMDSYEEELPEDETEAVEEDHEEDED